MNKYTKGIIQREKGIINTNANNELNTKTSKLTKTEYKKKSEDEETSLEFYNLSRHRGFIKLYDVLTCYPSLSLTDRIVYCTCKAYAQLSPLKNFTGVTSDTIANRLDISRATVSRSISNLQRLGVISIYKNERNQRFIKIERDFEEEQEEEKQYWATHEREFRKFNEINKLTNSEDFDNEEEERFYESCASDFE